MSRSADIPTSSFPRRCVHWPALAIAILLTAKQWCVVHSFAGTVFGPFLLVSCFGISLLLTSWLITLSSRRFLLGAAVMDIAISSILYADLLSYRQFKELPTVSSLGLIDELVDVRTSLLPLLRVEDLLYFCSSPLLLASTLIFARKENIGRPIFTALFSHALSGIALVVVATIGSWNAIFSRDYLGSTWHARHLGTPAYHAADIYKFVIRRAFARRNVQEARETAKEWFRSNSRDVALHTPGLVEKRNIIVVQIESLQTAVMGLTIKGHEVTPVLNRLSKQGMYFPNVFAQIARGGTADANFLANCSLLPTAPEIAFIDYAANDFNCLPNVLARSGYTTFTAQPVPPDCYNFSNAFRRIGFEKFYDKWDFKNGLEIGFRLSDGSLFDQTLEILDRSRQPFYAYITTTTSHTPFMGRNLPRVLDLGGLEGTVVGNYLHAIRYVDEQLGIFLEKVERNPKLNSPLIVLFGDHAGVHRQNSTIAQIAELARTDEIGWQFTERAVPLIVLDSKSESARTITNVAGQVDIATTILGLLGSDAPIPFMGRNLLEPGSGIVPLSNGSVISDSVAYLSEADIQPAACFELPSHKQVAVEQCRDIRERASKALEVSRSLIETNAKTPF